MFSATRFVVFVGCLLGLCACQQQPTFPNDWTAIEADGVAVFQGDYSFFPETGYCCLEMSNCEVQTEFVNGTFYFDYTHNRTRQDVSNMPPPATYITDYTAGKEMLVDSSSMDCLAYCPTDGDYITPGFLVPNSTDEGPTVLNGQKVEKWMFQEKPLGPKSKWVVETNYVYVDQSVTPAVPVEQDVILTPFGFAIGEEVSDWYDFVGGTPNAKLFAVNNVASCPMSNGCNDDTSLFNRYSITRQAKAAARRRAAARVKPVTPPSHEKKPTKAAKLPSSIPTPEPLITEKKHIPQSTQPVFPNDWTANQIDYMVEYQGDFSQQDEMYCCSISSTCTVQTGYDNGIFYFDFTHNRTRFDDSVSMTTEIIDFTSQMDMLVSPTNMSCLNYCPLLGETLEPGFLDPSAVDEGQAIINGVTVEDWRWNDTFAFWVMEISDVFVDQSQNPAVPVQEIDQFTPFGQSVGGGVTYWSNFTPGTPKASLFAVKNTQNCPQSPNCQEPTAQKRRLIRKLYKTWRYYEEMNGRVFPAHPSDVKQ